jgi:hypothetical protein
MSWFRKKVDPVVDSRFQADRLHQLAQDRAQQSASKKAVEGSPAVEESHEVVWQSLPAEAQEFLDSAMKKRRDRNQNMATLRAYPGVRAMFDLAEDFIEERTRQTIKEWLKDETCVFVWFQDEGRGSAIGEKGAHEMVAGRPDDSYMIIRRKLTRADVDRFISHWESSALAEQLRSSQDERDYGEYLRDVIPDLHGGIEHEELLMKAVNAELQKQQVIVQERQQRDLEERIDRLQGVVATPMEYTRADETATVVEEATVYPVFASYLRENGLDEASIFDLASQLSTFIEQSRKVLPRLTPEAVKQFEARVLLAYYKERRADVLQSMAQADQQRARAAEETRALRAKEDAERQTQDQMRKIDHQLSTLNRTAANQAHDVARIKWLEIIDGLFGR